MKEAEARISGGIKIGGLGRGRWAEAGAECAGTPGALHGPDQDQDQEGLVQVGVVQLRGFSEAIGHEVAGQGQFF